MNRRSFFVFAAVFMMILLAFSPALAADTVAVANDDNSLCAGLYGGSTLSDKMTGSHSKDGEWDIFTFTINNPLAESDWKEDENFPQLFDLIINIKVPEGYTRCKVKGNGPENDGDIENGVLIIANAVRPDTLEGLREYNLEIVWENDSGTTTTYEKIRCIIIDDSAPKPVPKDRINAGMGGALKRDGFVLYPNAASVSTQITAPEGAAYYSLNNSTTKTAVTDGKAVVAADANTAYTISWYADENSTSPKKAETLSVSFYYEPVPVSWLKMGFRDKWENVTTTVPESNGNVTGDLVFEFDLTDGQWQELLYNSVDSQYLHWPFEINLPKEAAELSNVGTFYKNEEGIDFIFVANYFESYGRIGWPIEIANVSTDGSKAIVTPENLDGTYLFKWKDESGVEHFHQINFQIKHASEDAVVVDSVEPGKSRIKLNVNELENVDGEYQDGVVTYSINEEPGWDAEIITTVERPNSSVAKVNVINTMNDQNWVQELGEGNIAAILGIPADEGKEGMITYKLEWLNSNDKLDSSDLITVKVLPIYAGVWMDEYWAPVESTQVGIIEDAGLSNHLAYKNGGWTFEVNPASKNTLDVERLSENERLVYILVPEGAKYFRMTSGESSLYWYDGADSDKEFLERGDLIKIEGFEAGIKHVKINGQDAFACHFGSIFTKSSFKNDNLDVYVVNEDVTGHGTYRIIEWFDESEKQIYFGEKRGQYIYMEKKPYMQTAETELGFDIYDSITPNPGEAYAIVWDYEPDKIEELKGLMFRCEVPLQKETHGNHRYVYQKLDLIDADGNVVELPKGTTIKVVLPYPEGLNKNNTQLEFFDVWHYEDETHDKYESMRQKGVLALENIGVTFITDSFSPFLLSYEPDEESKIIESLVPGRTDLKITQREEVPKDAGFYGEDAKVALEALYGTEDTMAAVKVKLEKDADEDISSIPGVKSDTFESVVLEISLQYWDDSSKEWKKITKDNLSLLPKDGVDVIIPFELFDFTDVNHLGNYEFLVKHLITLPASDLHYVGEIEDMKVTVTGEGLKIKVKNGFSPFVVAYAEKYVTSGTGSSSGKSSISVTYNGGSSFSTSKSAVPTSVEIDGVPVSFTGDGNSFTVSEIPAGAKWITVRWNSTSITTNFTPDASAVCTEINIPKTGDISLIAFALMAVAAAAGAMGKK